MKKLFSEPIFDILPTETGFIVVYRRGEVEDKVVVSYKSVSVSDGLVTPRTRADYEYIKFGNNYNKIDLPGSQFVTCSSVKPDDGSVFTVTKNGEAQLLDANGFVEWQGTIRYKDCGPSDIACHGHTLWASFAEHNALIRFNLRTMREELRIGGSNDSSFSGPTGLWVCDDERLMVCNSKGKSLLEVNMKTYTVSERADFDEPVHKYIAVGKKEFVVLNSGLYLL